MMMKRSFFLQIATTIVVLMGFNSCVYQHGDIQEGCVTYMTAFISEGYTPFRAQVDHSINEDNDDFEDKVNTLAMLVFPSGDSAEDKREAYHFVPKLVMKKIPTTKLIPGDKDIYFFANVDETSVSALKTRADVEEFLKKESLFDSALHTGATKDKGFPMSRVYKKQNIPAGYTYTNPFPWEPNKNGGGTLEPVSTYGGALDPIEGRVGLVRTCAKITMNIKGEGLSSVTSVKYINAMKYNYLMELVPTKYSTELQELSLFDATSSSEPLAETTQLRVYVPERLFDHTSTPAPKWDTTNDVGLNGLNYIVITTNTNKKYTVPIVHNGENGTNNEYITFAKENTKAKFDVVRNHHYHFNVDIPADGKQIEVSYKVMPWTLVESEIEFVSPVYTMKMKVEKLDADGNPIEGEITEVESIGEVTLAPNTRIRADFKISKPIGTMWIASITNGLNFEITGEKSGLVESEIVGADPEKTYTFYITPRQEFSTDPYYTQFYITIDGREINLAPDKNGYVNEDTAKRWVIKQVMN